MKIAPTIGRKVWFWMSEATQVDTDCQVVDENQAFDATVVFVRDDGKVDLFVIDHHGESGTLLEVSFQEYASGTAHGGDKDFATWMPYQTGQAKKDFAEAKREEAGS